MADPLSFGDRLRHERERRKIELTSIAASTKISVPLLEGLERDDLSRWPAGIFRRSFVRSYAEAIGLDADEIVREFVERHPVYEEPQISQIPIPAAPAPAALTAPAGPSPLRLRIEDVARAFRRGDVLGETHRRWLAVACDVGLLLGVAFLVFAVVGRFWEPLAVVAFGYYGGGILFLGNTPGVCLFAPASTRSRREA